MRELGELGTPFGQVVELKVDVGLVRADRAERSRVAALAFVGVDHVLIVRG